MKSRDSFGFCGLNFGARGRKLHIPGRTVDRNELAVTEPSGGVPAADDSGDPILAGDDGGVSEGATNVGDNGSRAVEERGPGGRGQGCHEDLADRRVILYCSAGSRSALAAKALERLGYGDVAHLEGGITRWKEEGFPTQSG